MSSMIEPSVPLTSPDHEMTPSTAGVPQVPLFRSPYLWIFLFALISRLLYITQSARNPLFAFPLVDARMYDDWARRMAAGRWFWDSVEGFPPVYPAFLAVQKILFGENEWFTKLLQSLMGSIAAVLIARIGSLVWNRRAGILAGFLYAANWMFVLYDSEKFAESFCLFFQAFALFLLICRRGRPAVSLVAGLAFALAAGARPNLLLVIPFIVTWLAFTPSPADEVPPAALSRRSWLPTPFVHAALFMTGALLVVAPILIRNHQVSGAWILRGQSSWNLYAAVEPSFKGLHPPPGVQFDNYMRMPIRAGIRSDSDIERFWTERALGIIREYPAQALRSVARHALIFANAREWSQEFDVAAYRAYSWWLSLPWPGFWLIGPLGLLGLFFARPVRRREWALLLLVLLAGILSIVPLKATGRYRMPTTALLTPFAAAAVIEIARRLQAREWLRCALPLVALLAFIGISAPDWPHLRERQIARHDFYIGTCQLQMGRPKEAIESFRRSMSTYAWDADSPYRIGSILLGQKQYEDAAVEFREALRREPNYPEAMTALAEIAFHQGNLTLAENLSAKSGELYPNYEQNLLLRARIRAAQGREEEELAYYRLALREGGSAEVLIQYALRLQDMGRFQEALAAFSRLIDAPAALPFDRARAAMLAGNLFARHMNNPQRAHHYWEMVPAKLPDPFFVPQALFLCGKLSEADYRRKVNQQGSDAAARYLDYNVALALRLAGQREDALSAYTQCIARGKDSLPAKWARQDLASLGGQQR